MSRMLEMAGAIAGVVGLLVCIVSSVVRLSGEWYVFDFDLLTLFTVGIGLMVAACFFKLQAMGAERRG